MSRFSRRSCFVLLLTAFGLIASANVAWADAVPHGPVTALAISGDRLLIGQGTQFVDAKISPDQLTVTTTEDLKVGTIRSIAVRPDGSALVLSEAALTLIDNADRIIDSVPLGGQQVILNGDQVFVAALDAGVRRFQIVRGKLTALSGIKISAPADSIAFQGTDRLWIAEGAGGLWEYLIKDPAPPAIVSGEKSYAPATLVRASDPYLIVGYGNRVAVLITDSTKAPHPTVSFALGESAQAGDTLVTADGTLMIGQVDAGGSDVIVYPLNTPGHTPKALAQLGSDGAGEQIVRDGNDFFYGSARTGLQRVALNQNTLTAVANWPMDTAAPCALSDYTPILPDPVNHGLAKRASDGSITLNWHTDCAADRYVVQINGQADATVDQPPYHFTPPRGISVFTWQINAQVGTQTIDGAHWSLETSTTGLLTIPADPDLNAVLYQAPGTFGRGLIPQTPFGTFLMVCALGAAGLLVIAIGAWLVSTVSTRSHSRRL